MNNVGKYIESLMIAGKYRQADVARAIGVQRQLLSYVVSGKREMSIMLASKLESFFNLDEGDLVAMQAKDSIRRYKAELKAELVAQLLKVNAFWSYANVSVDQVSDEELIEKTFEYLDVGEISKLFELYKRDYIRQIWLKDMVVQGDYRFNLNVMIAMYYFDIKQPERYLREMERKQLKKQFKIA